MTKPWPKSLGEMDEEDALISAWREQNALRLEAKESPVATETTQSEPDSVDQLLEELTVSPAEPPLAEPASLDASDDAQISSQVSPEVFGEQVDDPKTMPADREPNAAEEGKNARVEARKQQVREEEKQKIEEAAEDLPKKTELEAIFQHLKDRKHTRRARFASKFLLCVLLPTICVWFYVSRVAVPLYEANSVISVAKPAPDTNNASSGILSALGGTGHLREAFMVLEFIKSPALMIDLEEELGLVTYYAGDEMDPIGRVRDIPFLQLGKEYLFGRYLTGSINVQNGLISVRVRARSRDDAIRFSNEILQRAEEHLNELSASLFHERLEQANSAIARARAEMRRAQRDLVAVQVENAEVDPHARVAGIYEAISQLESDRLRTEAEIAALARAGYTDTAQMREHQSTLADLTELIGLERSRLIDTASGPSLNQKLADHEIARASIVVAEQTLAAALAGLNEASRAAELGVSRLQVVVPPQAADIATSPNRLKVIALAFGLFLSLLAIVGLLTPRTD